MIWDERKRNTIAFLMCYDPRTWLGTPHVMSTNHVTPRRPLDMLDVERTERSTRQAASAQTLSI